jgi:hypothetical protein
VLEESICHMYLAYFEQKHTDMLIDHVPVFELKLLNEKCDLYVHKYSRWT